VSKANQALRQLIDVVLDAAAVGVEEVARHQDAVLALSRQLWQIHLLRTAVICHCGGCEQKAPADSSQSALRHTDIHLTSWATDALRCGHFH
jgi:hypothetical protein